MHLRDLGRVPTGLNPDGLLTFSLTLPANSPAAGRTQLQKRLLEAVRAVPGVTDATFTNQLPLKGGCQGGTVHVEGRPAADDTRRVSFVFTTPSYQTTMAMALRAGRFLDRGQSPQGNDVTAVVNQAAVNRYWPDRNPIGASGRLNRQDGTRFEIVGVVGDVRNDGLNSPPEAELYLLPDIIPLDPVSFVAPLAAAARPAAHRASPARSDESIPCSRCTK